MLAWDLFNAIPHGADEWLFWQCLCREENPEDPDVVRKTAFGQRYTWYIPDYQFRKRNGQQVRLRRGFPFQGTRPICC